ncbi:MAG: hypothetical protein HQL93_12945 [Magnetococcales bacterium]|nr:hypothetical protein [Magnetococcales bacterium]
MPKNSDEPQAQERIQQPQPLREKGGGTRPVVQVTPATTVMPNPEKSAFTIQQRQADGSDIHVNSRILPDGRQKVTAYQNVKDPTTKTQTRTYHDGRRVIIGQDFVTRSSPGRPILTTHSNGLREAYLPDRQHYFREEFFTPHKHHSKNRMIRRTVYVEINSGSPRVLPAPIVQVYEMVPVRDVVVYTYYPTTFEPSFYSLFLSFFATPVIVSSNCLICPPPVVVFTKPIEVYHQPVDLLVDLQLAGAMDDGLRSRVPIPMMDPDVRALSTKVAELEQELAMTTADNAELRSELADQQNQLTSLQMQMDSLQNDQPIAEKIPVPIPGPVRKQFRKQVEKDILAHQQEKPLALNEILNSPEAKKHIFQVAETLEATDAHSDEECLLTTGDLIQFDHLPDPNASSATMKVVTSKADSCRAGSVVNISLWDLQEMLNAFRQRLENNMQKVHQELSKKG